MNSVRAAVWVEALRAEEVKTIADGGCEGGASKGAGGAAGLRRGSGDGCSLPCTLSSLDSQQ